MSLKARLESYVAKLQDFRNVQTVSVSYATWYKSVEQLIDRSLTFVEYAKTLNVRSLDGEEARLCAILQYDHLVQLLDFHILLRDVHLNANKQYLLDEQIESYDFQNWKIPESYFETIHLACDSLIDHIQTSLSGAADRPEIWEQQIAPVDAIYRQLEQIKEQHHLVHQSHADVGKLLPKLNTHKAYFLDYNVQRIEHVRHLRDYVQEVLDRIEEVDEEISKSELDQLVNLISKNSKELESEKFMYGFFRHFKGESDTLNIPIYANGGEMQFVDLDLDRSLEEWSETEVFPKVLDIDSEVNALIDTSLISLFNVQNKMQNLGMSNQEKYDLLDQHFEKPIRQKLIEINNYLCDLEMDVYSLNATINRELNVAKIFDIEQPFLPVTRSLNLTKLRRQNLWYEGGFWTNKYNALRRKIKSSNIPWLQNVVKDAYSFVESRQIPDSEFDLNSLFLKKGFLGRSFYINRDERELQFKSLVDRWQKGYQGSALVLGHYGSGKSSFLDYIPLLIEDLRVIQLKPQNTIHLNGRKYQVDRNLSNSINFLASNSINQQLIVCIDDLELWQNEKESSYETIKELIEAISKYGKRLFFVISTNHFMHHNIQRLFDFDSIFADTIVLDKMHSQDIVDAIVVRQNASLKEIKTEAREQLSSRALKIARKSRFNIGSSMYAWERYLDFGISPQAIPPDFYRLVQKYKLVLRLLLTHRKMNESLLRAGLSHTENTYLSKEIRSLIGYKIVERSFDGTLTVNPIIAPEVEYCLKNQI